MKLLRRLTRNPSSKRVVIGLFLTLLVLPLFFALNQYTQTLHRSYNTIQGVSPFTQGAATETLFGKTLKQEIKFDGKEPWVIESLDLALGNYESRPVLFKATIRGANCVLRAPWWSGLPDNLYLRFDATSPCVIQPGEILKVTIWATRIPGLALLNISDTSQPRLVSLQTNPEPTVMALIQGAPQLLASTAKAHRRFEALAGFWGFSVYVYLCYVMVAVLLMGWSLLVLSQKTGNRFGVAVAALIAGGCIYVALISPPMQGPDEATHFVSYLNHTQQQDKVDQAKEWMQNIHYPRVNCQIAACIADADLSLPTSVQMPHYLQIIDISDRTALGALGLKWYAVFTAEWPVNYQAFGLRVANSGIAGSLMFVAMWLFFGSRGPSRETASVIAAVFMLVPTFSYMLMHANNHGLIVTGVMAMLVGCLSQATQTRALSLPRMFGAGLFAGWTMFAGRSGFISAAVILPVVTILFIRRSSHWKNTLYGIASLGAGVSLFVLAFMSTTYVQVQIPSIQRRYESFATQFGINPLFVLMLLVTLVGVLGVAYKVVLAKFPAITAYAATVKVRFPWGAIEKTIAIVVAVTAVILLIYPLHWATPQVPDIEYILHRFTRMEFVFLVFKTFWLNMGFTGQDFFIHWSLWAGYGCPDRAVPGLFIQIVKAFVLIGIAVGLCATAWHRERRDYWLIVGGGLMATMWQVLVAYQLFPADYSKGMNPHGRFFMGFGFLITFIGVFGWQQFKVPSAFAKKFDSFYLVMACASMGFLPGAVFWLERFFR